ncbi:flagellar export chaperone FlgN [Inediibacterium massiliense]|uniref:flagellar export chaperone FlgN n=1 Tax=Inediibacterium massiliense TaxID=1658111 RepID=UPI0006B69D02|nr:flagellar export chaperone FlgN [Inediibacterium massiliense]
MRIEDLIDILIEISIKKEGALKKILHLTIAQETLSKNGDIEKVKATIEQKKKIIHQIHQMDIDFLSSYSKLKNLLNVESLEEIHTKEYPSLKELKIKIEDITGFLKKIEEIDKRNTIQVKTDFEKLKKEMKDLNTKQQESKIASIYAKKYAQIQKNFPPKK